MNFRFSFEFLGYSLEINRVSFLKVLSNFTFICVAQGELVNIGEVGIFCGAIMNRGLLRLISEEHQSFM